VHDGAKCEAKPPLLIVGVDYDGDRTYGSLTNGASKG
jgi:hypothetical protein